MKITSAKAVLLSDTALSNQWDGFRNGDATAKNIRVTVAVSGEDMIFANVQAGQIIECPVTRIYSSNTTAVRVEGLKIEK